MMFWPGMFKQGQPGCPCCPPPTPTTCPTTPTTLFITTADGTFTATRHVGEAQWVACYRKTMPATRISAFSCTNNGSGDTTIGLAVQCGAAGGVLTWTLKLRYYQGCIDQASGPLHDRTPACPASGSGLVGGTEEHNVTASSASYSPLALSFTLPASSPANAAAGYPPGTISPHPVSGTVTVSE